MKQDVLRDPDGFLLVQEPLCFLEMLRQMRIWGEKPPRGATAIMTTPEPFEAEAEVEEENPCILIILARNTDLQSKTLQSLLPTRTKKHTKHSKTRKADTNTHQTSKRSTEIKPQVRYLELEGYTKSVLTQWRRSALQQISNILNQLKRKEPSICSSSQV